MARPVWEKAVAWGIADHLRRFGLSDEASYSNAALIVRDLDRRFGVTTKLGPYASRVIEVGDVDDPEKTSPEVLVILQRFWTGVSAGGSRAERAKLLLLASASLLSSGPSELAAAAALSREAREVESVKGRLGQEWKGLSGLREDVAAAAPAGQADVVRTLFDNLSGDDATRTEIVKSFQTWAKHKGWYSLRVDGAWGDGTEAAWLHAAPSSGGRRSTWNDVLAVRAVTELAMDFDKAIGLAITRDLWLFWEHPDYLPAPAAGTAAADVMPTPDQVSQIIVSYPKMGAPATQRVDITLPPAPEQVVVREVKPAGWRPSTTAIVGGVLAVIGAGVIVAAVWPPARG